MNYEENYQKLGKLSMNGQTIFDETNIQAFSEALLLDDNLDDIAYTYLIGSIPYEYSSWQFSNLSTSKIDVLINNKKLLLSQDNIDNLKQYFPDKHIALIEQDKEIFLEKIMDIELDNDDILKVFKSSSFDSSEKDLLIEKIKIDDLDNKVFVDELISFFLKNSSEVPMSLFDKIFEISHNLKFLAMQIRYLDNTQISTYLERLDSPNNYLAEKSAKPLKLDNNEENRLLVEALDRKSYISSAKYDKSKIKVNRRRS